MRRSVGKEALKALTEGVRGLIGYFFNSIGQNENPPSWGLCPLSPAADIVPSLRHPETARAAGTAATTNSKING
jgi:hypothetical protein